jgi:hypothetical protein
MPLDAKAAKVWRGFRIDDCARRERRARREILLAIASQRAQLQRMMLNSNLCRAQADECLLLALEKPDDATALSGIATGWQALAAQIDRYHTKQRDPDPAFGIL